MKVKPVKKPDEKSPDGFSLYGYQFTCPGCCDVHVIATETSQANGARWKFSGDLNRPTFTPSINARSGKYVDPTYIDDPEGPASYVCHFFINNGNIQFLSDCTHRLSNKTVELPDIE